MHGDARIHSGMDNIQLIDIYQLSRVLKSSPSSIRRAIRAGRLPVVRLQPKGPPRFNLPDVLKAISTAPLGK